MKRFAIPLGLALAVSACTVASEEDQLENAIRENLSSRGNVIEVELTKQGEDRMTGHAVLRTATGEGRMNCTAQRTQGTNFNWQCNPTIGEADLTAVENAIRTEISQQGSVEEVEMQRVDDNNMRGFVRVSADGEEIRADCTATRDSATATFNFRCGEGDPGAAQPAAESGDK